MSTHWDRLGGEYALEWEPPAKQALSRAELAFVTAHLRSSPGGRVLDVGVGSGRVLDAVLAEPLASQVVGIDASDAMVAVCRARFAGHRSLEAVEVRDVAAEGPPGDGYGFVSAIRVLKYEEAWRDAVAGLAAALVPGGVLAFSMPNRRSLNALSRPYAVPWHVASIADLEALVATVGLELLQLTAFTKLPHAAYTRVKGDGLARVPLAADRVLTRVLGPRLLGRELFVAARMPR